MSDDHGKMHRNAAKKDLVGNHQKSALPSIMHVWEDNDELATVVAAGFRGSVGSKWYWNNGGDWTAYYTDDPLLYVYKNANAADKQSVVGGLLDFGRPLDMPSMAPTISFDPPQQQW